MDSKVLKTMEYEKILHRLESYAATALGKEQCQALMPSGDFEEVKAWLQETDEAAGAIRLKGSAPFGGIHDVRAALKRSLIGGILSPLDLLHIADTISGAVKLKRFIESFKEEHSVPALREWSDQITGHLQVEKRIKQCINENAEVADQASAKLGRIRQQIRRGESGIREKLEHITRSSSNQKMLQDAIITIRNERYVIPVKQEYRAHFGGMVHDQSSSGATLFIEPAAVVELNNRLRTFRLDEQKEIEIILTELTEVVAEIAEALAETMKVLAHLDFVFAKASLAASMRAVLPLMNDRGFMKIKKGRHPLLAEEDVVPLDIELGNEYAMMIITGPNTGGKTVTLKTAGLLSLMAMSGLFIPAEDGSKLCVFDTLFADIGDEQSIEQSLSTFSGHLNNIIRILKDMTPKSLILLDELGAGTDPSEGSALAISILEYIDTFGCRVVATTHFSELKAYAYEKEKAINASMEFNVESLSPTYRLLMGVPGRSNAFAIASRLGLPKEIITVAQSKVGQDDRHVETMIASLEKNRQQAEDERLLAEQRRSEGEQFREKLRKQQEQFEMQKDKLLQKAEKDAEELVAKARKEAEQVIADLRQMALQEQASIKEHKLIEAKRRLNEAVSTDGKTSTSRRHSDKKNQASIEPGDEVRVAGIGQRGYVIEFTGNQEALVQIGIMKTKVAREDLELVSASGSSKEGKHSSGSTGLKRTRSAEQVRLELDLRGTNLQDAIMETEQFMDQSLLNNVHQIQIIHGKGTGVLRSGIQEYLRKNRHVKSFRFGNFNEGGNGVTVVELQ